MRIFRKILFYFFVLAYLIVCPVTILYALGYIWRPGEEKTFVKTGLIYLSTTPSGALVTLDKNEPSDKTPTVLRDLVPGNYPVSLELKDYRPWSQILPVQAEKATVLEKILLLPRELPVEELAFGPFDGLTQVKGTHFLILTNGPLLKDCILFDTREKKLKTLVPGDAGVGSFKEVSFSVEEESPFALVRARSDAGEKFLWTKLEGADPEARDATSLFPDTPQNVAWDFRSKDIFYSFGDRALNRLDVSSNALYPKIVQNIHGYGFFNHKLYLLDSDNRLRISDGEGKNQSLVPYNSLSGGSFLKVKYFYRLRVLSDEDILFLGEKGDVWTNQSSKALVESGVEGSDLYLPLKKALIWRRDRIGVIEFPQRSVLDKVPEEIPKVVWVYEKGADIRQAFWLYEGSHILFRDGDKVGFLELETFGAPRSTELFTVKHGTQIGYSEAAGKVYYIDAATGRLCSAEIFPRNVLLS